MKKIQKSIMIDAPREVVWASIININKFQLWSAAFTPTSTFVGGWQQGQSIQFLMKDEQGQTQGMLAEIVASDHLRHITIHHIGLVSGDVVDYDSDEAKKWVPAYEIYDLESLSPGVTRFSVNVEVNEDYLEDMADAWSDALQLLKEVCEKNLAPFASITVTTDVLAPVSHVWECWRGTECIKKWNHASDDWHCPAAINDFRVGGRFVYTMAAVNGSVSFDFAGTYMEIVHDERITSQLDDGRMLRVTFEADGPDHTRVVERFEAENENTFEGQRKGWQTILDNFKRETEVTYR